MEVIVRIYIIYTHTHTPPHTHIYKTKQERTYFKLVIYRETLVLLTLSYQMTHEGATEEYAKHITTHVVPVEYFFKIF